jgi:hypothetical protein
MKFHFFLKNVFIIILFCVDPKLTALNCTELLVHFVCQELLPPCTRMYELFGSTAGNANENNLSLRVLPAANRNELILITFVLLCMLPNNTIILAF